MMLRRKAYKKLLDWKNECQVSKAMLIEGARRIGKSTLAEEFTISNNGKLKYKIYPIEVKTSKNYTAVSLNRFKKIQKQDRRVLYNPP